MHRSRKKKLVIYARLLIFVSIILFCYGFYLDFSNPKSKKLIDPIKDVEKIDEEENFITITTSDGSEIVSDSNSGSSRGKVSKKENNTKQPSQDNNNLGIEGINNNLRNEIQKKYNITIKYGNETSGYSVKSGNSIIGTNPMTDPNKINSQLHSLDDTLSLYPSGIFNEIKNGGIPLTITLIESYTDSSITGVTDSSYDYANISIAAIYSFDDSFYHESYHYIERYMFKNGANFNSWDTLNPNGFSWNTIDGNLSYSNTFSQDAPFVNNYAQTAATEDRASTFEYMMAGSKASCLNNGTTVWKKANYMAQMMRQVLSSVKRSTNVRWEQYLY